MTQQITYCSSCNFSCFELKEYLKHAKNIHPSMPPDMLMKMKLKFWFCRCCYIQFDNPQSFWKHKRTNSHKYKLSGQFTALISKNPPQHISDLILLKRRSKFEDMKVVQKLVLEYFNGMDNPSKKELLFSRLLSVVDQIKKTIDEIKCLETLIK